MVILRAALYAYSSTGIRQMNKFVGCYIVNLDTDAGCPLDAKALQLLPS
jgi:hypothetical protein